eukprot:3167018-Pyramimonas_sp.AAC.1
MPIPTKLGRYQVPGLPQDGSRGSKRPPTAAQKEPQEGPKKGLKVSHGRAILLGRSRGLLGALLGHPWGPPGCNDPSNIPSWGPRGRGPAYFCPQRIQ